MPRTSIFTHFYQHELELLGFGTTPKFYTTKTDPFQGWLYHTRLEELNIVIAQVIEFDRHERTRFYLGSFTGKENTECTTRREIGAFYKQLKNIVQRKNRIAGKDLNERVFDLFYPKTPQEPVESGLSESTVETIK